MLNIFKNDILEVLRPSPVFMTAPIWKVLSVLPGRVKSVKLILYHDYSNTLGSKGLENCVWIYALVSELPRT